MACPLTVAAVPVGRTSGLAGGGVTGGTTGGAPGGVPGGAGGVPGGWATAEAASAEPRMRAAAPRVIFFIAYSLRASGRAPPFPRGGPAAGFQGGGNSMDG